MQVVRSLYRAIPTYGVVRTYYALTGLATKNYFYVLVKMEAGIKKVEAVHNGPKIRFQIIPVKHGF